MRFIYKIKITTNNGNEVIKMTVIVVLKWMS